MPNEFDEYEESENMEDAAWMPEHDFALAMDEAESPDEVLYDEELGAALDDEFAAVLESEIEQNEDPIDFDQDFPENEDDPEAPISRDTLFQQMDEFAVERLSKAARKETDFEVVISEMDRLDRNRERRERYHEVLRGDVPLEYQMAYDGTVFPEWMGAPCHRLITKGQFLDVLYDCPYEMHDLTADSFLSGIVKNLKEEHKEVLYFLYLRLYSTRALAEVRGQSDRNVRKVRDTYTRKLQRQLYDHLCKQQEQEQSLSLREKEFMALYAAALEQEGKTGAKVKRENKTPKRKKATLDF